MSTIILTAFEASNSILWYYIPMNCLMLMFMKSKFVFTLWCIFVWCTWDVKLNYVMNPEGCVIKPLQCLAIQRLWKLYVKLDLLENYNHGNNCRDSILSFIRVFVFNCNPVSKDLNNDFNPFCSNGVYHEEKQMSSMRNNFITMYRSTCIWFWVKFCMQ